MRAECRQYTVLSSDGCAKAPKRYVLRRVRIVPVRHLLPLKKCAFPSIRALLRGAFSCGFNKVEIKVIAKKMLSNYTFVTSKYNRGAAARRGGAHGASGAFG